MRNFRNMDESGGGAFKTWTSESNFKAWTNERVSNGWKFIFLILLYLIC